MLSSQIKSAPSQQERAPQLVMAVIQQCVTRMTLSELVYWLTPTVE